ncbi:hypothetical protein Tco_1123722 [Tanacetum coccineum]|uniref:Uncharacterized protein n=1 Tax=Tanacetum coccineum TaxID=301880 RepID=A0ABQ5J706_9ASTR
MHPCSRSHHRRYLAILLRIDLLFQIFHLLGFVPSYLFIERVDVMDKKRSRVLPNAKLSFRIVKRGKYFSIAAPGYDKKRGLLRFEEPYLQGPVPSAAKPVPLCRWNRPCQFYNRDDASSPFRGEMKLNSKDTPFLLRQKGEKSVNGEGNIFPLDQEIKSIGDQYWVFRAEEVSYMSFHTPRILLLELGTTNDVVLLLNYLINVRGRGSFGASRRQIGGRGRGRDRKFGVHKFADELDNELEDYPFISSQARLTCGFFYLDIYYPLPLLQQWMEMTEAVHDSPSGCPSPPHPPALSSSTSPPTPPDLEHGFVSHGSDLNSGRSNKKILFSSSRRSGSSLPPVAEEFPGDRPDPNYKRSKTGLEDLKSGKSGLEDLKTV